MNEIKLTINGVEITANKGDTILKAAEDNGIPYLLEPLSGGTGTNLSAMHRGCGLTGALISIPIKYMHTPCETAALGDIEAAAQLLAASVAALAEREASR